MLGQKEKAILAMAIVFAAANTGLVIGAVALMAGSPSSDAWLDQLTAPRTFEDDDPLDNVCIDIKIWMLPLDCFDLTCLCHDLDPTNPCDCSP